MSRADFYQLELLAVQYNYRLCKANQDGTGVQNPSRELSYNGLIIKGAPGV